jgi:hypothetical protein
MGAEGTDAEGGAHMAGGLVAVIVTEDLAEVVHGREAYVDSTGRVKQNDLDHGEDRFDHRNKMRYGRCNKKSPFPSSCFSVRME